MRSIFYLQRNDRNAIIVILMIIAIICSLIIFIGGEGDGSRQGVADSTLTLHPERVDKEHPLYYKVDEEIHEVSPSIPIQPTAPTCSGWGCRNGR